MSLNGVKKTFTKFITNFKKTGLVFLTRVCKKRAVTPLWVRTYDIRAHRPDFEIRCRHDGSKMLLRFSELYTERAMNWGIKQAMNAIEYKCPRCSLTQRFLVEDDPHYLMDMLDLRGGIKAYIPPKEEWEAEHEEIKKRLEILGYM